MGKRPVEELVLSFRYVAPEMAGNNYSVMLLWFLWNRPKKWWQLYAENSNETF